MGPLVAVVAVLIVLGLGGYFGYRLLGEGKDTVATVDAPKDEPPANSASADTSPPTPLPQDSTVGAGAPPAETPPSAPSENVAAAAPTEASPAPALPGAEPAKSDAAAAKAARLKAAPKASPGGTEAAGKGTASPTGAPAPARALAKAPTGAAPAPDRWQMYAEALAECEKLDFFSRFGCEQKQRWHYCDGYWGQVPQCPLSGGGLPQNR